LGLPPLVNPYPALNLDFINNQTLDSRVTFSRGSQATLFDSTGALRYAKHNLFTYSQGFDDSSWTKNNSATVTANAGVAPDGTTTADQFNGAAIVSSGVFKFPSGAQSGVACTFSLYVKNVSAATTLQLGCDANPSNAAVVFNAVTGVITSVGANVTSSSVINAGNGWYRVIVNFTTTSTGPGFVIYSNSLSVATWLVWGAQLNLANMEGGVTSSLTTYYPTTTAAYYAPRFDYNPSTLQPLGLLIEEARTNSIRNNTMVGAVAGTPGTFPTNWVIVGVSGTSASVVEVGTEDGISYIDIRVNGTPTSNSFVNIITDTAIAASSGQTWAASAYVKLQAGSLSNTSCLLEIREVNSGGGFLANTGLTVVPTSAALKTQRSSLSRTLNNASTTNVRFLIDLQTTNGAAVDITLRIGLPQLELGAFATSVIPTTTTALTRNADVASMTGTNFSSWFNLPSGTVVVEWQLPVNSSDLNALFTIDGNAALPTMAIRMGFNSGRRIRAYAQDSGGVFEYAVDAPVNAAGTTGKSAFAYRSTNDFAVCDGAGTVVSDTSGSIADQTFTTAFIGRNSGAYANGTIRRIAYYPTRLPDATLQALTA
jgi:hypothetical protein